MIYPSFLSDFQEACIFSTDFQKLLKQNFMKICPVGAELFHAYKWRDQQMDRHDKASNSFSQFCECALYRVIKKSLCTWRLQYKSLCTWRLQYKSLCTWRLQYKSLCTWRLQYKSPHIRWFEDGHRRIHSECGPCYTDGLREHSSGVSINVWRLVGDTLNINCNLVWSPT
jgi:hypothetical protein